MANDTKIVNKKTTRRASKPSAETAQKTAVVSKRSGGTVASLLSKSIVGVNGEAKGSVTLPESLFGAKSQKALMSQSVRVYLANQRTGFASTKTRGEVEGSTRKIYKQKGTGRARHGGIRAPIFVGGGITFGPKPREYRLDFPKKMRMKALAGALSAKLKEDKVVIVDGLSQVEPKTKSALNVLTSNNLHSNKLLIIYAQGEEACKRGFRNISGVTMRPATALTAFDVLWNRTIVVTKDAISALVKTYHA